MRPAQEKVVRMEKNEAQYQKDLYFGRPLPVYNNAVQELDAAYHGVRHRAMRLTDRMGQERKVEPGLLEKQSESMMKRAEAFRVNDVSPVSNRMASLSPAVKAIGEDPNLSQEGMISALLGLAEKTGTWLKTRYEQKNIAALISKVRNRTRIPPHEFSEPLSPQFQIERMWSALEKEPEGKRSQLYLEHCAQGPTSLLMIAVRSQLPAPVPALVPVKVVEDGLEAQWAALDAVGAIEIAFLEETNEQMFLLHLRAVESLKQLGYSERSLESWRRHLRFLRDLGRKAVTYTPGKPEAYY